LSRLQALRYLPQRPHGRSRASNHPRHPVVKRAAYTAVGLDVAVTR
jgi:hypothetical protein